ncbi:MAG: CmcJ/NvfI family oxidoreductase [Rhodospirillales bacterium]
MNEHAPQRFPDIVEAPVSYLVDTGVKPVSASHGPGGRLRQRTGTFEEHTVAIRDARTLTEPLSLDREGFLLTSHETAVTDFFDEGQLRSVYYPEMERLIGDVSGASKVIIFDHTLRSGDEAVRAEKLLREPVQIVHNDYTNWSGPQRVRDALPAEEAEALLQHRLAIVQVWRAIRNPIRSFPLAICDARSVAAEDLIAAERRHVDRVGEIYQLAYNPDHKWFYFPEMNRNEALVFKVYDSLQDGRARFTAHSSFDDPTSPPGAPPRESIEIRAFAFFETV